MFSALDAETANSVFEGLFGNDGALRTHATILVTHATKFLQRMNSVVVLAEGSPIFSGTFSELKDVKGDAAIEALHHQDSNASSELLGDETSSQEEVGQNGDEKQEIIMTAEGREFGLSQFATWLVWFKYAGGWTYFLLQIVFLVFDRAMYVGSEWYVLGLNWD